MSRRGEKTRSDIVGSANRLFYEHGFGGTSFTNIVSDSGIYRGNVYHYFKSKDEILHAVIAWRLDEYRELVAQWELASTDPRQRLAAFVGMVASEGPSLTRLGCPIGSLNTELAKDRRDLQTCARALFDLFRDWLTVRFTELGREPDKSRELAMRLLARAQGIAVLAHVYQDAEFLQREIQDLMEWVKAL